MTEREKIAARCRALAAKTIENGCTEAEALAAAAKLAQLLADYNLTLDEADLRATPFSEHREAHADEVGERLWKVAHAICVLTDATYWRSGPGVWPIEVHFFGFEHEVGVSRYLLEICARAMRNAQDRLNRANAILTPAARRRAVLPFLDGMADRLHDRILALVPPASTGTGLVVVRKQLVDAALAEAGIHLQTMRPRASRSLDPAYGDGQRFADGVALNPGLTAARPTGTLR
jgi:hypothetical protein